jgi:hypothetical protein
MSALKDIDLSNAYRVYAISNTPIFLIKQLKADAATNEIARNFSGEQIISALRDLVGTEPTDSLDFVRPYVYLVSLSKISDIQYLRAAANIEGTAVWDWFRYIQQYLLETYSPVITEKIESPKFSSYSSNTQLIEVVR